MQRKRLRNLGLVVAETFDRWLSDPGAFAVRADHVRGGLAAVAPGPFGGGNVGGGTGMITREFKADIRTASRQVEIDGETRTVGVLIQTNDGRRSRSRRDGKPIGSAIPTAEIPAPWPETREQGSIIAVPATDRTSLHHARFVPDGSLEPLFEGVIDALEESTWNALCAAETMTRWRQRTAHAIPRDALADVAGGRID